MDDRPPLALWADAGAAIERLLAAIRESAAEGSAAASVSTLTEAYLIAVSSGLRCAGRLAEACERERAALAAFMLPEGAASSDMTRAEATAALRALAAELGEVAVAEARRFRIALKEVAERLPDQA